MTFLYVLGFLTMPFFGAAVAMMVVLMRVMTDGWEWSNWKTNFIGWTSVVTIVGWVSLATELARHR